MISVQLVETDQTAAYDYDRATARKAEGGDWSSTYRMASYFLTINSRKIYESLTEDSQRKLAAQLAAEWKTYLDYYTMKLKLTYDNYKVYYDLSKSGILRPGHCYGSMELTKK